MVEGISLTTEMFASDFNDLKHVSRPEGIEKIY